MTSYTELCEIADKNDVLMISGKLHNAPSIAICDGGACTAIFDYSKIHNEAELMTCMAHEVGHCATGAFYTENTLELRSRMEYRANKWAIKKLIPRDELEENIKSGYTEVWQLAELFCVTEDMMRFAMWIYFDISAQNC